MQDSDHKFDLTKEKYLSIFEEKQDIEIDENKLRYMASKIAIRDFFGIPSSQYFSLSTEAKSKMLRDYYLKNLVIYFDQGKI